MAAGHVRAESGLQLLARLGKRKNICDIEQTLFPSNMLKSKDVIELRGASGSGKTLMLTHLLAKCILSREFGGQGAGAILINTDHHFQLTRLVGMLEHFLKTGSCKAIQKELKTSLGLLTILTCYDSLQLSVTLDALNKQISTKEEVSLLVFDSPAAYYWADAHIDDNAHICSKQVYLKNMLEMVLSPGVYQQSLVFVYTVCDAFLPPKLTVKPIPGLHYHKVFLNMIHKSANATSDNQSSTMGIYYSASVGTHHQSHNSHNVNFVIKPSGIHWMP